MKHTQSRQTGIRILMLAVAAIMLASAAPCLGQSSPDHVPNQLIVTLQPGSNIATARQVASAHGMQVAKKLPLADTYLLEWDPSQGYDIHGKITELKGAGAVIAEPNAYCKFDAVPNDSLYGDLWGMEMINMPAAWDIEKGKDSVIVAVIDTAFYLRFDYDDGSSSFFMHPDIKDRLLPGYDFGNNDDDPSMPFPNQSCATHGLHVAGTIAATTDNNEGVAGVCWEGVKILPIKVIDDASIAPNGDCTFTITSAIEGLDYAMRNGAKVVNNSWGVIGGRSVEVDSLRAKIRELLDAGIIVVASAGNSGYSSDPSVGLPAAFDGVIAVSAVGPDEALAYYSSYGREVDIAAPGGDMSVGGEEGGIRSTTIWTVKDLDGEDVGVWGYLWWQGTSMASPHVAGAAALLLSLGVPAANVPYYLTSSAKPAGEGRPNDQFGWGILDVHAALQMAAEIKVVEPSGSGNVYTGLPFFTVKTKVIEKSSIKVYIGTNVDLDMDGIPDDRATPLINSTNIDNYYDDESRQLSFQLVEEDPNNLGQAITYPIQPQNPLIIPQALEAGPHRICIIGDIFGSTTKQVKTIKVFSVVPKIIPAGISLMSVPYALANGDGNPLTEEDPQDLTDDFFKVADYQLARWIPASSGGNYAVLNFPLMVSDSRASLFPPNTAVQQQGAITTTPPAGMGYWLQVGSDTPLLPNAVIDDSSPYDIPVIAGWNMIGDPFPFNVDWNGVLVTYQERTLPISEAVSAGWLRSSLYRYNRVTNAYAVDVLPLGSLAPWQGYWIKALKGTEEDPLKLTILPIPSYPIGGVLTAASPSAAGLSTASMGAKIAGSSKDDWSIKLVATAGTASDAENVAGASSRSVDGYDGADIENPPSLWRFVDLSFPHRNWGGNSGSYTRDIRAPMTFGKTKTWEFEVNTDIAKTDVRLTWPDITSLPKGYSATLEDVDSGKKLSMRTRGAYSYNAGTTPGKRRFKMTVAPSKADRLVISKVSIASIRPTGVKVSYTISHEAKVEVRIYRGGRKPVRILGLDDLSAAGAGSIIWDGKITNGSKARTGLYTFEIIATDADGRIAKVTRMCLFRR